MAILVGMGGNPIHWIGASLNLQYIGVFKVISVGHPTNHCQRTRELLNLHRGRRRKAITPALSGHPNPANDGYVKTGQGELILGR